MTATAFATYGDVEARWRTLASDERIVADTLLDDASDMIRTRWSDVDSRITSGALTEATLKRIVAVMVKRAMINANTEGLESHSATAGPFSIADKFANPNGNLYFTAEDLRALEPDGYNPRVKVGWLA